MTKPNKDGFKDDGRRIANMDLEGTPWARKSNSHTENGTKKEFEKLSLTRKERRAMILGAIGAILPIALAFIGLYLLALFILDLIWLS